MSKLSSVYWIYDKSSVHPGVDGYVGISVRPFVRHREHLKRGRVPVDGRIAVLFEGTREQCFHIEMLLRPQKSIGWNSAAGGQQGFRAGYKLSEAALEKMSARMRSNPTRLKGRDNPMFGKSAHAHGLKRRAKLIKGRTYEEIYGLERGKHLRQAQALQLSEARKRRGKTWQLTHDRSWIETKLTCPHCAHVGQAVAMKRWHFDHCKRSAM